VYDGGGDGVKVIIGGCGRVGAQLATKLAHEGHEVVVIDKDPTSFRRLGKSFNGTTVRGMVFDRDVLEKAGTDRADSYVAVTSGDNSNVVSATIAREIFRVPKVVARIFDPRRAEIYRRLGIQTVSSVTWAANEISSLVLYPHLVRDLTLGDGEVQLVKISVPPRIVGRTVADITMTGETLPFAIVRGGKSFIPATHETLHEGDIVEVAVLTSAMDRFQNLTHP
jgi:trk system potassium uptake protein TrkA